MGRVQGGARAAFAAPSWGPALREGVFFRLSSFVFRLNFYHSFNESCPHIPFAECPCRVLFRSVFFYAKFAV